MTDAESTCSYVNSGFILFVGDDTERDEINLTRDITLNLIKRYMGNGAYLSSYDGIVKITFVDDNRNTVPEPKQQQALYALYAVVVFIAVALVAYTAFVSRKLLVKKTYDEVVSEDVRYDERDGSDDEEYGDRYFGVEADDTVDESTERLSNGDTTLDTSTSRSSQTRDSSFVSKGTSLSPYADVSDGPPDSFTVSSLGTMSSSLPKLTSLTSYLDDQRLHSDSLASELLRLTPELFTEESLDHLSFSNDVVSTGKKESSSSGTGSVSVTSSDSVPRVPNEVRLLEEEHSLSDDLSLSDSTTYPEESFYSDLLHAMESFYLDDGRDMNRKYARVGTKTGAHKRSIECNVEDSAKTL